MNRIPASMEDLETAEAQVEATYGNSRAKAQIKTQLKAIRTRLQAREKLAREAKRREIIRRLQESGWTPNTA